MRYRTPYRLDTKTWSVERIVFLIAGIFVAVAALLTILIHPGFIWADLLFGVMLAFFGISGYCPMAIFIDRIRNRKND